MDGQQISLGPMESPEPPPPPIRSSSTLRRGKGAPNKPLPDVPKKAGRGKIRLFRLPKLSNDPKISSPTCVTHDIHVVFDANTGEFRGMPEEWLHWLRSANISVPERERNPELVIEVLQCYDAATHARRQKFLTTCHNDWSGAKTTRSSALALPSTSGALQSVPISPPPNTSKGMLVLHSDQSRCSPDHVQTTQRHLPSQSPLPPPIPPHASLWKTIRADGLSKTAENAFALNRPERDSSVHTCQQSSPVLPRQRRIVGSTGDRTKSVDNDGSSTSRNFPDDFIDCGSTNSYSNISSEVNDSRASETLLKHSAAQFDTSVSAAELLTQTSLITEQEPYGVEELLASPSQTRPSASICSGRYNTVSRAGDIRLEVVSTWVSNSLALFVYFSPLFVHCNTLSLIVHASSSRLLLIQDWNQFSTDDSALHRPHSHCCISEVAFVASKADSLYASGELRVRLAMPEVDDDFLFNLSARCDDDISSPTGHLTADETDKQIELSGKISTEQDGDTNLLISSERTVASIAATEKPREHIRGRTAVKNLAHYDRRPKRSAVHPGRQSPDSLTGFLYNVANSAAGNGLSSQPAVHREDSGAVTTCTPPKTPLLLSRRSPNCRRMVRLRDEQIIDRIRTIVSEGEPLAKYETLGCIGHG
ncbi:hypothetical protein P879_03319 [Paragonimus westermani]|uniref:non-specific serine/threonine protein kinase n=1 Tax=Paragonimus westermani TaxID=34504 RepID=A0A8T0D5C8_9TREM|nr:hypothetical protein P879_03319 [Paragonimus westermani]